MISFWMWKFHNNLAHSSFWCQKSQLFLTLSQTRLPAKHLVQNSSAVKWSCWTEYATSLLERKRQLSRGPVVIAFGHQPLPSGLLFNDRWAAHRSSEVDAFALYHRPVLSQDSFVMNGFAMLTKNIRACHSWVSLRRPPWAQKGILYSHEIIGSEDRPSYLVEMCG